MSRVIVNKMLNVTAASWLVAGSLSLSGNLSISDLRISGDDAVPVPSAMLSDNDTRKNAYDLTGGKGLLVSDRFLEYGTSELDVHRFNQCENIDLEASGEILQKFVMDLVNNMQSPDPEMQRVLNEDFWDLLD
jgi:hypothetical protein